MIFWKLIRYFSLLLVFCITASACEKFSGDQTIPAYLSIDSIYLTTDYLLQGSASHNITDAWVYADDEFLGVFELPAKFPVLKNGKHKVKVWPGVRKNGIAATRVSYEFFNPVIRDMVFTPDSTSVMGRIMTTYETTASFTWMEDFENIGMTLDTTNRSTAHIELTSGGSPLTFEGNHSGMVVLDSLHDVIECQTHNQYAIPQAPVYLEMNFNTANALTVGLFSYGNTILYQTPVMTLNPTSKSWKKIYIELTTTLNAYPGVTHYRVYFYAMKDKQQKQDTIRFDNFKVVTRKSS